MKINKNQWRECGSGASFTWLLSHWKVNFIDSSNVELVAWSLFTTSPNVCMYCTSLSVLHMTVLLYADIAT